MNATVNDTDLLEVIADLTSERASGRLQIKSAGSAGAFFFKNGKLIDARMGPFSGFPAVNYAVSLGEARLNFDSSIEPPALIKNIIAPHERTLLKERFGIEADDLDIISEEQTLDSRAAIPGNCETVAVEAPTFIPKDQQEFTHKLTAHNGLRTNMRVRESRRRTARSGRATLKEKQARLDQPNVKDLQRSPELFEQFKLVELENENRVNEVEASGAATPVQSAVVEPVAVPHSADVAEPVSTLASADDGHDDSEAKVKDLASAGSDDVPVEPMTAFTPLFWTLIVITFFVSIALGYYVSHSFLRHNVATPTSVYANEMPTRNIGEEQPVVDGPLNGKESVLEKPDYPSKARSEGVSGKVTVAIQVNKDGQVVSARALSGEGLLRVAAVAAARKSKFSPEKLEQSRTSGTITYNFKLD